MQFKSLSKQNCDSMGAAWVMKEFTLTHIALRQPYTELAYVAKGCIHSSMEQRAQRHCHLHLLHSVQKAVFNSSQSIYRPKANFRAVLIGGH